MSQETKLIVNVDDIKARVKFKELDSELQKLQNLASKAVSLRFDENGEIIGSVSKLEDSFGRVVTINQRFRDDLDDEGKKIGVVEETTANISLNYEKIAKAAEKAAKQQEQIRLKAQQYLIEEENSARKASERAEAERLVAEQKAKQVAHAEKLKELEFAFARDDAKKQEEQEYREAQKLLEIEEQQRKEAAERAEANRLAAEQRELELNHARKLAELEEAFSNARLSQTDSYLRHVDSEYTIDVVNRTAGISNGFKSAAESASVFAQLSDDAFEKYTSGAINGAEATSRLGLTTGELGKQTEETSKKVDLLSNIYARLANIILSKVTNAFKQALNEMKNVDSALVVVRKVTDASTEELEALRDRAYEVGAAYGVLASDYLSSAAEFSRAGYKEQAGDLAELATKLQLVGDVSQDTANKFLIATDKAYGLNGNYKELSKTIDQLNEIDNNFATSIQKMADGMGIIAPIASQAHVSVSELEAAIGTITATTQRSGAESARALRALFLNIMGDTQTEIEEGATWTAGEIEGLRDVLEMYSKSALDAAEATGEVVNPMEAIAGLAEAFSTGVLNEKKLIDMVSDIGGKLRSSQLLALIQNWDMYNDMLKKTEEAAGSADKEVKNALDSWEVKLNILKNTWTDFIQKTLDTKTIKNILNALTWLIKSFGSLGTVISIVTPLIIALKAQDIANWAMNAQKAFWNFAAALTGTGSAASVAAANLSVFAAIVAALVIAINAYKNSLDNAIAKGTEARNELDNIESLYAKYEKLNKEAANTEEANSARDALIEKLKDEGVWVDSVTGKYADYATKIREATKAAIDNRRVQLKDALAAVEQKIFWDNLLYQNAGELKGTVASRAAVASGYQAEHNPNQRYGIEELVKIYDLAIQKRAEFDKNGEYGSAQDKALQAFINHYQELIGEYLLVKNNLDGIESSEEALSNAVDEANGNTEKQKNSFIGLSDEIKGATQALEAYKKALEDGEKGDTLKAYADVYKSVKELFEKGLTGTNQYKAGIEALFGTDWLEQNQYDYEKAGQLLGEGFSAEFYKAAFAEGGEDFGWNAANFLFDNANKSIGRFYTIIGDKENGFSIAIDNIEGLAKELGTTEDVLWSLVDSWDAFDSSVTVSKKDIADIRKAFVDPQTGVIDALKLIDSLVSDGRTASDIHGIISGLQEMGDVTLTNVPENLQETIDKLKVLHESADAKAEGTVEIETNPEDPKKVFTGLWEEIKTLEDHTVYIGVKYKEDNGTFISHGGNPKSTYRGGGAPDNKNFVYYANSEGTNYAKAGLSLVNEDGAELIVSKNEAYIANGGEPAVVMLKTGDRVYNAEETAKIGLRNSANNTTVDSGGGGGAGDGNGSSGSFISPTNPNANDKGAGGSDDSSSTPQKSPNTGKTSPDPSNALDALEKYIEELLKKAKEALDQQVEAIDAEIEALKRQHDAEEEANELEELKLRILEAEKKLIDAQNERTVRYFNKETGQWEWQADQKAVQSAQKELDEAQKAYYDKLAEIEYNAKLQELEDRKNALKDSYDKLSENWDAIRDAMEKALNEDDVLSIAEILAQLGLTSLSGSVPDIQSLIGNIESFTKNPSGTASKPNTSPSEVPLEEKIADALLSGGSAKTVLTSSGLLSKLLGISTGDIGAKSQSLFTSLDRSTSSAIAYNYYIDGIKIDSDMAKRPLSEILSVLPIYSN